MTDSTDESEYIAAEATSVATSALSDTQMELIVKLLAQGYTPREVSLMWEIPVDEVRKLEQTYQNEILDNRALLTLTKRTIDAEIDEAEALAIQKIRGQLPMISDPMQLTKIFSVLNAAKRRTSPGEAGPSQTPTAVVQLPVALMQQFNQVVNHTYVTDSHNRITEVAGRQMTSAPNSRIQEMLALRSRAPTIAVTAATKGGLANDISELTLEDLS